MRYVLIYTALIVTSMLTGIGIYSVATNTLKNNNANSTEESDNQAPIEFRMTREEEAKTSKWKNKSMDDLVLDAHKGDSGALYMIGICFLMGHGWAIDMESADYHFAQSASLGFAPALDKICSKHRDNLQSADDMQSLSLAMIYLNLTISEGHQELLPLYYKTKAAIIADVNTGQNVAQEIERIAIRKKTLIQKNKDLLRKCLSDTDKHKFQFSMQNVTDEDLVFDNYYWKKVRHGIIPSENEIYCLTINRNARKAEANKKRLKAYHAEGNSQ